MFSKKIPRNPYDRLANKLCADQIIGRYTILIQKHNLNPNYLEDFKTRLHYARYSEQDVDEFFDDEFKKLHAITNQSEKPNNTNNDWDDEPNASDHADKIIDDYKKRIDGYTPIDFPANGDLEILKLFGAMKYFDFNYWKDIQSYMRRALPQYGGRMARMTMEQTLWTFVSTKDGKVPEALEPYKRIITAPNTTTTDIHKATREILKHVSFFIHDVLKMCEKASATVNPDENVINGIKYMKKIVEDFRLKSLRRG